MTDILFALFMFFVVLPGYAILFAGLFNFLTRPLAPRKHHIDVNVYHHTTPPEQPHITIIEPERLPHRAYPVAAKCPLTIHES